MRRVKKVKEKNMRVHVSPMVIKWVIQNSDFDQLSDEWKLEVARWLDFGERPTIQQVKELSELLYIPFGYFFLDFPPNEDCSLFELRTIARKKVKRPSRNLVEVVQNMRQKQRQLSAKRNRLGYPVCRLVGAGAANRADVEQAAILILEALKIDLAWTTIRNYKEKFEILREKLSDMRTLVVSGDHVDSDLERKLSINEFRAFVLLDDFVPLIFVNTSDNWRGSLFALVHEMVHLWMGTAEMFDGKNNLEQNFRNPDTEIRAYKITKAILDSPKLKKMS